MMKSGTLLSLAHLAVLAQALDTPTRNKRGSREEDRRLLYVHAATAALAWVIFFPLGSILLRLMNSKNVVWVHAAIQAFSTSLFVVGVGTGIYLAKEYRSLDLYHQVLGLVIFALVFVQIAGGTLHHLFFRRYQKRTVISYMHIWLGRILVTAGMINGGLGLLISRYPSIRPSNGAVIAYSVIAAVIWIVFIVVGFWRPAARRGVESEKLGATISTEDGFEKREIKSSNGLLVD